MTVPDGRREPSRRVLFVVGAGRSGTSTLTVLLQRLGMHVPQPEVSPDESNPRGFGEPRWVVDYHDRLLEEALVTVGDSRPVAWSDTGRLATRETERRAVASWLEDQLAVSDDLVVKDPRLGWFLGLWQVASVRCGVRPVYATMLRPPAEVVRSRQRYYHNRLGTAHLAASWLNMQLHIEQRTRSGTGNEGRVFVRYADLLRDWVTVTRSIAERLELQPVLGASDVQMREAHRFLDPSLHRVTTDLEDLALPGRLHDLVRETWAAFSELADPDRDTEAAQHGLDQLREAYVELYEEAEAISRSSAVAAHARGRRHARDHGAVAVGDRPGRWPRRWVPRRLRSIGRLVGRR